MLLRIERLVRYIGFFVKKLKNGPSEGCKILYLSIAYWFLKTSLYADFLKCEYSVPKYP
jgi:hypothetical protein